MPLQIEDHGTGNVVEIGRAEHAALNGRIIFSGNHARVAIGPGCSDGGMVLQLYDHATAVIGAHNHLGGLFVHAAAHAHVALGDACGVNGHSRLLLHEPASIAIGSGCLIAADVDVTVSDMHPIFDAGSGARINPAAGVVIADRVWIGQRSLVLKGASIGADTVIGAGSIVTGAIPAGVIAAGNPARVIRTGIRWRMDL